MTASTCLDIGGGQGRFSPVILRWILSTEDSSGVVRSEDAYELFRPGEEVPSTGFYKIDLSRFYPKNNVMEMQCDRTLEPVQPSESKIQ
ncbi:hypothetical protein G740_02817 [Escherichia coli HVH 77 (4-2605759)]|nr:hypothetical protein G740_02817 [Escherichia coli HVH 77 (4-2605759)]